LAGADTVLSITACYGTLAVLSVLSLLGVTLAINPGVWAWAISLFALLALGGVTLVIGGAAWGSAGYRNYRAALVVWAMVGSYSRIAELAGFAGLITAAIWDWRLQKCEKPGGSGSYRTQRTIGTLGLTGTTTPLTIASDSDHKST
jgi:hypothetical protein